MSYAHQSCALAGGLSRLLADGSSELDDAGYAQALVARSATLALAADVHREVAGIGPRAVTQTVADLEAHPVAAFGRALNERPRIEAHLAPTEVLSAASMTSAGRRWREVARHAIVAHHEWASGLRRAWAPIPAWSALADVAALTEAVIVLDRDLAMAADALGRGADADGLASSASCGLRVAAAEVQALARAGPLAVGPVDREPVERGHVLPVTSSADLPPAQARLGSLLSQALCLRPEHALQIAIGQARNAVVIARSLRALPEPDAGRQVEEVANGLDAITASLLAAANRPQRTASVYPGDPRPLYQAGELTRHLVHRRNGHPTPDEVNALVAYARNIEPVLRALKHVADRETLHGRWLIPDQRTDRIWTQYSTGLTEPRLLTGLRDVIPLPQRVSRAADGISRPPSARGNVPLARPPREALATAIADAQRVRPTAPGRRPELIPGHPSRAR